MSKGNTYLENQRIRRNLMGLKPIDDLGEIVEGKEITDIGTIGSRYANGYVIVQINGHNGFRMHVSEILKMVNEFEFNVEQKRVYKHLSVRGIRNDRI